MIRLKLKSWFQWSVPISTWNAWNAQNSWFPLKTVNILELFVDWRLSRNDQSSHTDWKNGKNFFPVREKSGNFVQTGKVREIWTKYWKSQGNLGNFYFFVLFLNELYLFKMDQVFQFFRPTWWVSSVVIQFGESWCPTTCTCSPSTDSILGLLLTSYTIWVGMAMRGPY